MVRRALLLTGVTVALAVGAVASPGKAAVVGCTTFEVNAGLCQVSAGLGDGEAVLRGTAGRPGSGVQAGGASDAVVDPDPMPPCVYIINNRCMRRGPAKVDAVPVQPVTLADIAAFRPSPGVDLMEPNGWMIVGLDTNFYSAVGVQVQDGSLLGQAASVRFTPVTWNWTYGDGDSATRGTPGGSWGSLGIPEFDPTPTSHVYRAPGTYYIDLSIGFAVEYRFDGMPWTEIPGILTLPANRLVATAGGAKTVLVERECTLSRAGPGC